MSTQNKKINHNFSIGTVVFIINESIILPCVIVGINGTPTYNETSSIFDLVDDTNIQYDLIKISKTLDENNKPVFRVSNNIHDKYNYHNSKVYGNVDDLLSDLEKTIEKF